MNRGKDLILVTGATGKQGGSVARELLANGHKVRAMTRKPDGEAARELARLGAEIVPGDLDDAVSLERAVLGAWGVFAVQNTWEAGVEREEEQGKRLAEVARRRGVQHYVYSSVGSAHRRTGIPHFENKWRIEEKVRSLGFPSHVVLRPVFFMENWTSPWSLPALQEGKLAIALERHAELNRREIDIAGDQHTMPETAQILSQASSRQIRFVPVPIGEVRKASGDQAAMLEWFDRVGYDADIAKNSRESGIRPTT